MVHARRRRHRARPELRRYEASDPYRDLRTSKLRRGDPAYAFELPRVNVDGGATTEVVRLADYLGRRPVVLVFGSYTCPKFRKRYPRVEALARRYAEKVVFLVIYGREAHPVGRDVPPNEVHGIVVEDPVELTERLQVARECARTYSIGLPLLVDGMDDKVTSTYGGRPAAARLIGASGRLEYVAAPSEAVRTEKLERAIRRELGWRWWRPWV